MKAIMLEFHNLKNPKSKWWFFYKDVYKCSWPKGNKNRHYVFHLLRFFSLEVRFDTYGKN